MSSDKFDQFQGKYPNLFREYPRSGFDLRPGWETLAETLCWILEQEIQDLPKEERVNYQCAQTKEKFGGLRWYMTAATPEMSGAIRMAEHMSFHICETCGMPGKRRSGGWILTLCDQHHQELEQERQEQDKKWAQTNYELECLKEEEERSKS